MRTFLLVFLSLFSLGWAQNVELSKEQAGEIGRRIWKNESGGSIDGLTAWNAGEEFASLGIAHFIWYPEGKRGPFEESFPKLVKYLASQGTALPDWLHGACPWKTRAQFLADFQSAQMVHLRTVLKATVGLQAGFAAVRLEQALPKMLVAASAGDRDKIKANFYRVARERLGLYALMDYVNFKGEGVSPKERYDGQGWGLLQVLEAMPKAGPALPSFVRAADEVLTRRVANSPPSRGESRWLPGWRNRLKTYLE